MGSEMCIRDRCHKLLKNVDKLAALNPPKYVVEYIKVFKVLEVIVHGSFGNVLSDTLNADILTFQELYIALKDKNGNALTVTPKIHLLVAHVNQFCHTRNHRLGPYSEQSGDTIHSVWSKEWKNYKCNVLNAHFP